MKGGRSNMDNVGFIGIGTMGTEMAGNIQVAGYPMVVYDVREEATKDLLEGGARLASSPAEVASLSDVVFTSVPGPKEVEEAATGPGGILEGIKEGGIYLDLSTVGPSLTRRLEPMFRQKGAYLLDAPVLNGPAGPGKKEGFTVLVGGDREIYERVLPILESFADHPMYCGSLGMGLACKLVNNMMAFGMGQIIAEALTLGIKAGVDLDTLMESGSGGVFGSRRRGLERTVFRGDFDVPSFTLALALKDVSLANEMAREVRVPMPMTNLAEQLLIQCMNRGWAGQDFTVAFRLQEEAAGVEVRDPKLQQ